MGNTIKNILVWVVGGAMLLAAFNALTFNQIAADNRSFNIDIGYFATINLLNKLRIFDLLFIFLLPAIVPVRFTY